MGTEWVAPIITGIIAIITATIAAVVGIRNVRTGAREARAPGVVDAWKEADGERQRRRVFEDLYYAVRAALKNLARDFSQTHPDYEIPEEVRTALELQPPPE